MSGGLKNLTSTTRLNEIYSQSKYTYYIKNITNLRMDLLPILSISLVTFRSLSVDNSLCFVILSSSDI